MRQIPLLALGFALLVSGAPLYAQANAGVEKALEAKEQAGWQSWKDHNPKPIEEMIPEGTMSLSGWIFLEEKSTWHLQLRGKSTVVLL